MKQKEIHTWTWSLFSLVCSFETKITSWTSFDSRSEFLPNIWKFESVNGGKTTNVSHEQGILLLAMIILFLTKKNNQTLQEKRHNR